MGLLTLLGIAAATAYISNKVDEEKKIQEKKQPKTAKPKEKQAKANKKLTQAEIDANEKETFLNNVYFSVIETEPTKTTMQCFDVNEKGLIAIGTGSALSSSKKIIIYDIDGNFQKGLQFNCSGSFGLEWINNNLNVYFVRSDVAVSCDLNGNITSIKKIDNTKENNSYWNKVINSQSCIFSDGKLLMKNDMGAFSVFASSYSQLVFVDQQGQETIIYDVSTTQKSSTIIIVVLVVCFISIIVGTAISGMVRFKKQKMIETNTLKHN